MKKNIVEEGTNQKETKRKTKKKWMEQIREIGMKK